MAEKNKLAIARKLIGEPVRQEVDQVASIDLGLLLSSVKIQPTSAPVYDTTRTITLDAIASSATHPDLIAAIGNIKDQTPPEIVIVAAEQNDDCDIQLNTAVVGDTIFLPASLHTAWCENLNNEFELTLLEMLSIWRSDKNEQIGMSNNNEITNGEMR